MTIDPRLYKKYSGRSGDPYDRLGAALAGSAAQKSRNSAAKDRSFSERYISGSLKGRAILGIAGSIVLLIVALIFAASRGAL